MTATTTSCSTKGLPSCLLAPPPPPPPRRRARRATTYLSRWLPFCDGPTLQVCSGVCREWREATQAAGLWEALLAALHATSGPTNYGSRISLAELKRMVLRQYAVSASCGADGKPMINEFTFKEICVDGFGSVKEPFEGRKSSAVLSVNCSRPTSTCASRNTISRSDTIYSTHNANRFSSTLNIPFTRRAPSGSKTPPSSVDAARKNYLARSWFGYPIATDDALLEQRISILKRNLPEVLSVLSGDKNCLNLQQEILSAIEKRSPSGKMIHLHKRATQCLEQIALFEEIAVQCLVHEALRMLTSPVDRQHKPKTTEDKEKDAAAAEVLRLQFGSLQKFVDLELYLTLHPSIEANGLARLWVQTKRRLPVDATYFDMVDLAYEWGPQWSADRMLSHPEEWTEFRRMQAEQQLTTLHGKTLGKMKTVVARRLMAGKFMPFNDFMSVL